MDKAERTAMVSLPVVLAVGAAIAWAGSQGGGSVLGLPTFAVLCGLAFLIQWITFIPSFVLRSERFFDITGSLTYISAALVAIAVGPSTDARSILLVGLIAVWACRLGTFLLRRVIRSGKDDRFEKIKTSFPRLLLTWTLQGLWVSLTSAAAWAAITAGIRRPLGVPAFIGLGIWLLGFGLEVIADAQKSRFRKIPATKDAFIRTGLWRWSRHPNYFGEILLWVGVAVIAAPVLRGWQWATLISPVFVTLLLTKVSGIPLLERRADKTWGGQADYEAYKRTTSMLVPRPPRADRT